MGAGYHGGFGKTKGSKKCEGVDKPNIVAKDNKIVSNKERIISTTGHITLKSVSERREKFLGKSVTKIDGILKKNGYETQRRPSTHSTSKAKIIMTLNSNHERNITQVQVSPGSKRHGGVPYVKISTTDIGKIKIIGSSEKEYKTDGKEKATLLFRRVFNGKK